VKEKKEEEIKPTDKEEQKIPKCGYFLAKLERS